MCVIVLSVFKYIFIILHQKSPDFWSFYGPSFGDAMRQRTRRTAGRRQPVAAAGLWSHGHGGSRWSELQKLQIWMKTTKTTTDRERETRNMI